MARKRPSEVYRFTAFLQAVFVFLLAISASAQAQEAPPLLTIFHTNDVHGHVLGERSGQALSAIGYSRLKTYVNQCPAKHKLLLDAGDVLHGHPLATVRQGELVAGLLAKMNYDALAVGNHDFDYGLARLMELRDKYELNFIAANIIEKEDGAPLLPPYLIKDFGDCKVGIFGLTTPETPIKTSPGNVDLVTFGTSEQLAVTARDMARFLREEKRVDLVVALTHLGTGPLDDPGAQAVAKEAPGIDLIIDGHSHSVIKGLRVGGALIVSTGAYLANLGQIDLNRLPEGGWAISPKLISASELTEVDPETEIEALSLTFQEELNQELNQVVASIPFDLNGNREQIRFSSTNFGRLVCAAMKQGTGADVAIINSGSIRGSIPAGDITRGRLLSVLPYGNYTVTVRLSGAELMEVINIGLSQPGEGGFPQFHGLNVAAYEVKAPDGAIISRDVAEYVEVNGRRLDKNAEYVVAINDFMYAGGDGYVTFSGSIAREYGTVEELLRHYLANVSRAELEAVNLDDALAIIVEEMVDE